MKQAYLPLRKVVAVGIGNALEFYDFGVFSYFAIQIGHAFFPQSRTSHGLLLSLASFGVGFIARPLGGIVIGRYGDRVGRKPAMLWSFGLMGAGVLGLALTPSYAQIGLAAPVLLVIFRLLQGFALGGEFGPSAAFLVESAPPYRRGLYVSLLSATQGLAVLAAGVLGFILSSSLAPAQLDAWGWRIAFLIGAAVVPVGLYIRRRLPETLHTAGQTTPLAERGRVPTRLIVLGLMMLAAGTITTYVAGYMTTYVQDTLKLGANFAFGTAIVKGLCLVCVYPISGLLSDRVGRKPVMLSGLGLLLVLAVPCYIAMSVWRSVALVYGVTAILSGLLALSAGPVHVSIPESIPRSVRSTGFGILYAVAIAVFGGSTQFVVKWLTDLTGNPVAPGWYLTGALAIGGLAMIAWRESAPCKVAHDTRAS